MACVISETISITQFLNDFYTLITAFYYKKVYREKSSEIDKE